MGEKRFLQIQSSVKVGSTNLDWEKAGWLSVIAADLSLPGALAVCGHLKDLLQEYFFKNLKNFRSRGSFNFLEFL